MPPKYYKKKTNVPYTKKTTKESANLASAKYLIIVESPSKCAKIEEYLGTDYCCIATKGHFRTINGLRSIDTKLTFAPTFSIIDEKKQQVEYMQRIIPKFSSTNIILATDDDREGEAIAWHVCKLFDLSIETTKRILFHEVTKSAIIQAVSTPTIINVALVQSAHARQVLDIIVGFKISPFLWKYLNKDTSNALSAGRCQTPALRLVYDNNAELMNSNGIETKYKTVGSFFSKGILFELNHEFDTSVQVLDFLEKTKIFKHELTMQPAKSCFKSPPKPFHTSRLLQVANNVLHMSAKETMNLCQQLYQNGHITYMRTESSQYSSIFLKQIREFIISTFREPEYVGSIESLDNKLSVNPHEAIRVTNLEMRQMSGEDESRIGSLYRLIWKNTVESCMSEYKYNSISVNLSAPMQYQYLYNIETPIFMGWRKVSEKQLTTESQNSPNALSMYFQSICKSDTVADYQYIDSSVVMRNKHQHYTEASLIGKLEELGIGRPSTFASIVDTIQERGYVKKQNIDGKSVKCVEYKLRDNKIIESKIDRTFGTEKNKLVIQQVGIATVDFLLSHFESMFSYEYTKSMEEQLDIISSGEIDDWSTICKQCYQEIKLLSKSITKTLNQTFEIDQSYNFVFGKNGPVITHKKSNGDTEYLAIKKDIVVDLEKITQKEYNVEDLVEIKNICLGKYEGEDLYVKNGKYGPYVEWGKNRESIKTLKIPLNNITLSDIEKFLKNDSRKPATSSTLRTLNSQMSVRTGKFGPYVYYKREDMSKPQFLNIKKFKQGFGSCDSHELIEWLCETYSLPNPN
jgi:DNA topoisomerase-1